MFFALLKGDRKFYMYKERIRFGGKGKMLLERVFEKLRIGSRWNSNQGLELGADVLWYFFVCV